MCGQGDMGRRDSREWTHGCTGEGMTGRKEKMMGGRGCGGESLCGDAGMCGETKREGGETKWDMGHRGEDDRGKEDAG